MMKARVRSNSIGLDCSEEAIPSINPRKLDIMTPALEANEGGGATALPLACVFDDTLEGREDDAVDGFFACCRPFAEPFVLGALSIP